MTITTKHQALEGSDSAIAKQADELTSDIEQGIKSFNGVKVECDTSLASKAAVDRVAAQYREAGWTVVVGPLKKYDQRDGSYTVPGITLS